MTTPVCAEAAMSSVPMSAQTPTASAAASTRPDALFVLNNLGIGGSERKIVRLANRLKDDGVAVSLVCMNGPFTLESGVRHDVPLRKLDRAGKFSFGALWRLRQILVRDRPQTVISVNLYPALYVMLATLLLPNRPRTVALVNTSTFTGHPLLKRLYRSVLARLDLTVHGSEVQRDFWTTGARKATERATVLYNGVDSDHFAASDFFEAAKRLRASLDVKPESLLLGTVGMCRPEKNQAVLLSMVRSLRVARVDVHLVIAGDGPMRAQLERRAAELGVGDRVHFVGAVEDVRPLLAALDIFLLPSIAVESFSNAALEAMSMGRPVILSAIGGAREMIDDGIEGYVVAPSELEARLPAIVAALYADSRKRRQMGAAARARAVTRFSVSAMVAGYRGLLQGRDLQ